MLEVTKVLLVPPGKEGPRLTRPTRLAREGTVTLRLTKAGERYLRRHSTVSITATDFFETVAARVVATRGLSQNSGRHPRKATQSNSTRAPSSSEAQPTAMRAGGRSPNTSR